MELLLLPIPDSSNDFVDYTQGIITRHYTADDSKYYFTLHPELYADDGAVVPTGRYLVVLLSPTGLRTFYIAIGADELYQVDDTGDIKINSPFMHEQQMVNEAGDISLASEILERDTEEYFQVLLYPYMNFINKAITEAKSA